MRLLRRLRKSSAAEPSASLDYRKVSEQIHERRIEREREPGIFRQNPEDALRDVRTYSPEERLRHVDEEARKLVDDAKDIRRTWDPEYTIRPPWSVESQYTAALIADVIVSSLCFLVVAEGDSPDRFIAGGIGLLLNAAVLTWTLVYFRELGKRAWIGLIVAVTLLVVLAVVIGQPT